MAVDGVTRVVSGFGSKREVDGSGIRVAILTRGMAVLEVIQLVRLIGRTAFGGLYRARTAAAATIHRQIPIGATAVSTVTSITARWRNIRRMAFNVTIYQKKRSNTAGLTGHALTKK